VCVLHGNMYFLILDSLVFLQAEHSFYANCQNSSSINAKFLILVDVLSGHHLHKNCSAENVKFVFGLVLSTSYVPMYA
jgi:hypothetical protein